MRGCGEGETEAGGELAQRAIPAQYRHEPRIDARDGRNARAASPTSWPPHGAGALAGDLRSGFAGAVSRAASVNRAPERRGDRPGRTGEAARPAPQPARPARARDRPAFARGSGSSSASTRRTATDGFHHTPPVHHGPRRRCDADAVRCGNTGVACQCNVEATRRRHSAGIVRRRNTGTVRRRDPRAIRRHTRGASASSAAGSIGREGTWASVFDLSGRIRHDVPLPGRGHGFAADPATGAVAVFARRPGDWALVLDPATGRVSARLAAGTGESRTLARSDGSHWGQPPARPAGAVITGTATAPCRYGALGDDVYKRSCERKTNRHPERTGIMVLRAIPARRSAMNPRSFGPRKRPEHLPQPQEQPHPRRRILQLDERRHSVPQRQILGAERPRANQHVAL